MIDRGSRVPSLSALRPLFDGATSLIFNGDTIDTRPGPTPDRTNELKEQTRALLASPTIERELVKNQQLGRALRVGGTPAWVIGDRVIPGVTDLAGFQDAVKRAREKS